LLVIERGPSPAAVDVGRRSAGIPREPAGTVLITVDPEHVAPNALQGMKYVAAVGADADHAVASFCRTINETAPAAFGRQLDRGQALLWSRHSRRRRLVSPTQPSHERQRHIRKYAEGELGEDKSFYFHGPMGRSTCGLRISRYLRKSQMVSTTGPGTIIYAPATIRAGSGTRSMTANLLTKSQRSRAMGHFPPPTVGVGSKKRSIGATPARHNELALLAGH
jgi:hypothetical protein